MKDNHDFFSEEQVQNFLRNYSTGTDNLGRHMLARIVAEYDNPTVLDVACASAVNHEVFKNCGVHCQYTGLDRTKKLLAEAKRRYGDEITLVEGYAQKLPFQAEAFDVVIIRHLLEHLADYEEVIGEAFRVASKELVLVFFLTPHPGDEDFIKESEPDENGCTYWWNQYSYLKLFQFLSKFNCSMERRQIATPNAAHEDTILRLRK